MAHFAELDSNNIVLRVVVACNQDITNNGGEQSEQAAKHFETICPFSEPNIFVKGVKWVQTSYNNNFRKNYAGIGYTYDKTRDAFIAPKPFNSWILNEDTCRWEAPVTYPTVLTYGNNVSYSIYWDDDAQRWIGIDDQNNEFAWIPSSSSWIATGN
jgi:hypothetical protein